MLRYQYLIGPGIAMAAVGVLSLVLRWMYSDATTKRRPAPPDGPVDYGLLVPVARVPERGSALGVQALLAEHGIRATLAPGPHGGVAVLVFAADQERARSLVPMTG